MLNGRDFSAARAGQADALEALACALWPIAFRVATAVLSDRDLAQDVAQDAVVAVLSALDGVREVQALPAYLRRTAARLAYKELLLRRREQPRDVLALREPAWVGDEYLDLRQAIAELRDEERVPLLLRYGAGLTSAEIGNALCISAPAVRFRLMRARSRLRESLSYDPEGVLPDAAH